MKLNIHADFSHFAKDLGQCKGEVYLDTTEGDHLNLKSTLSQFLLMSVVLGDTHMLEGEIICDDKDDYKLLLKYVL